MTSLLMKVALAAALTVASGVGLIGISGLIIFADVKPGEPTTVVEGKAAAPRGPLTIMGPNR
jgi:hypothetical protein